MKVLFDHPCPFLLAHGGFQVQIQQTKAALEAIGLEVEFLRWWDEQQRGEIVHYFGRPPSAYVDFVHGKNMRLVMLELLTGLGSRSGVARFAQKTLMTLAQSCLPRSFSDRMAWDVYRSADALLANTSWEAHLMKTVFGASPRKVQVVPNGVERCLLDSLRVERGPWLVCCATITERKRIVELAEAAVRAQTPLWVIGKAYGPGSRYARRFFDLVKRYPAMLRYEGPLEDRNQLAQTYCAARGFVLLSTMETRSLAAEEAAACECPLLLSDLPWARSVFAQLATYCPVRASPAGTAKRLRHFYDAAPHLPVPPRPKSWLEVAQHLQSVYATAL